MTASPIAQTTSRTSHLRHTRIHLLSKHTLHDANTCICASALTDRRHLHRCTHLQSNGAAAIRPDGRAWPASAQPTGHASCSGSACGCCMCWPRATADSPAVHTRLAAADASAGGEKAALESLQAGPRNRDRASRCLIRQHLMEYSLHARACTELQYVIHNVYVRITL